MAHVISCTPDVPLREQLRAFVETIAANGKPSITLTEHGDVQLDWPNCEGWPPFDQMLALMAAIDPERVLTWLVTEAEIALGRHSADEANPVTLQ